MSSGPQNYSGLTTTDSKQSLLTDARSGRRRGLLPARRRSSRRYASTMCTTATAVLGSITPSSLFSMKRGRFGAHNILSVRSPHTGMILKLSVGIGCLLSIGTGNADSFLHRFQYASDFLTLHGHNQTGARGTLTITITSGYKQTGVRRVEVCNRYSKLSLNQSEENAVSPCFAYSYRTAHCCTATEIWPHIQQFAVC